MDDRIRVTIASGQVIEQKHPSGLPGLPTIFLSSGDTLLVAPLRAEEMYRAGKVLHPLTGQPLPPQPREPARVQISTDGTSFAHHAALHEEQKAAEAAAEAAARNRKR